MATLFYNAIRGGEYISKEVPWTSRVVEFFIEKAMLNEEEAFLARTRAMEWTVSKQALETGYSIRTIGRRIEKLKRKYDRVYEEYPNEIPKRNPKSVKDKYLDTH